MGCPFFDVLGGWSEKDRGDRTQRVDGGDDDGGGDQSLDPERFSAQGEEDADFAPEVTEAREADRGHGGSDEESREDGRAGGEATEFFEAVSAGARAHSVSEQEEGGAGQSVCDHQENCGIDTGRLALGRTDPETEEDWAHVGHRAPREQLL